MPATEVTITFASDDDRPHVSVLPGGPPSLAKIKRVRFVEGVGSPGVGDGDDGDVTVGFVSNGHWGEMLVNSGFFATTTHVIVRMYNMCSCGFGLGVTITNGV